MEKQNTINSTIRDEIKKLIEYNNRRNEYIKLISGPPLPELKCLNKLKFDYSNFIVPIKFFDI